MSKIINKIDDELINSIDCDEINIYCSTEDEAKELLNQLYFIGYKWGDDTPINETYFNSTDYDGIIYNIYKCSNTIRYWGLNHSYDFEFKLEENNNSSNMKEVFEFSWGGFKNGEFEVVLKNREEANSFFNAMYDKYNIEHRTSYDEYFDFIERDDVFIKYNEYVDTKWIWSGISFTDKVVNWSDYMTNDCGKEFKNIKQEEIEQINIDNNLKISKEFDFEKWKDEGLYVIVNNKEEFVDFVKCVWEYFKVPYSDRCKIDNLTSLNITNLIFYNSCESDLWFRIPKNEYSEFNDTINNKKDKCINWCDYMDNNYFNQRDESVDLENIKNNAYKAILKELNKEDELKFSHEEIKDKFFDIDKLVLINCENIFKSIKNETDLNKVDDALNIIDKMVDVKNKLLNDFDI